MMSQKISEKSPKQMAEAVLKPLDNAVNRNSKDIFGCVYPDECFVDLKVKIIYDSKQGDIINQYIIFCRVFDEQVRLYGRTEKAVRETIRICKDKNVLTAYLKKEEVPTVMFGVFDKERQLEITHRRMREEARDEGLKEGREEGQKKIALNLYRVGISLENIAQYNEVSVEQIQKWISSEESAPEPLAA